MLLTQTWAVTGKWTVCRTTELTQNNTRIKNKIKIEAVYLSGRGRAKEMGRKADFDAADDDTQVTIN